MDGMPHQISVPLLVYQAFDREKTMKIEKKEIRSTVVAKTCERDEGRSVRGK